MDVETTLCAYWAIIENNNNIRIFNAFSYKTYAYASQKKSHLVFPYWVSQKEVVPFFIYFSQHYREFFKIIYGYKLFLFMGTNECYGYELILWSYKILS